MTTVREAYIKAKELTTSKYLQQILSFEKAFGFIFSTHRDGDDVGNLCIMISKDNPEESALIPIIPENLDFLYKGDKIPLSMIK